MGLDPGKADARSVASQEQDGAWSSQLAHDKSRYTGSKNRFRKLLFGKKNSEPSKASSFIARGTTWLKSRTAGQVATSPSVPKSTASSTGVLYICDCCLRKPKRFENSEDLR